MSGAELSVFVWGIYVAVLAVGFIFVPNVPLRLLKFEPTQDPWIRALGVVLGALAYYYISAALAGSTSFAWATVFGRFWILVGAAGLVLAKKAKPQMVLFGIVDAGGAVWTLLMLS